MDKNSDYSNYLKMSAIELETYLRQKLISNINNSVNLNADREKIYRKEDKRLKKRKVLHNHRHKKSDKIKNKDRIKNSVENIKKIHKSDKKASEEDVRRRNKVRHRHRSRSPSHKHHRDYQTCCRSKIPRLHIDKQQILRTALANLSQSGNTNQIVSRFKSSGFHFNSLNITTNNSEQPHVQPERKELANQIDSQQIINHIVCCSDPCSVRAGGRDSVNGSRAAAIPIEMDALIKVCEKISSNQDDAFIQDSLKKAKAKFTLSAAANDNTQSHMRGNTCYDNDFEHEHVLNKVLFSLKMDKQTHIQTKPVTEQFPCSTGVKHKLLDSEGVEEDKNFSEFFRQNISSNLSGKLTASIAELYAAKNQQPGLFNGEQNLAEIPGADLQSGFQPWIRQDMWAKNCEPLLPNSNSNSISCSNYSGVGLSLLLKMGWQPGRGLGKREEGPLCPIPIHIKTNRRGLSTKSVEQPSVAAAATNTHTKDSTTITTGGENLRNPVSVLNEVCLKRKSPSPNYICVLEMGPPHHKEFMFAVRIVREHGGVTCTLEENPTQTFLCGALANGKRAAKALAARCALEQLNLAHLLQYNQPSQPGHPGGGEKNLVLPPALPTQIPTHLMSLIQIKTLEELGINWPV